MFVHKTPALQRYGTFKALRDKLARELPDGSGPPFPPRFSKQRLGIALTPTELRTRKDVRTINPLAVSALPLRVTAPRAANFGIAESHALRC